MLRTPRSLSTQASLAPPRDATRSVGIGAESTWSSVNEEAQQTEATRKMAAIRMVSDPGSENSFDGGANRQQRAVLAMPSDEHQAHWSVPWTVAWNGKGAAVKKIDDAGIAEQQPIDAAKFVDIFLQSADRRRDDRDRRAEDYVGESVFCIESFDDVAAADVHARQIFGRDGCAAHDSFGDSR